MSKKTGILAIVLSVIAICLSLFAIVQVRAAADSETHDIQYVMYLGTNDKDTNDGGWIDGEKVYTEYTLVIYLSDTNRESVHAAADEMIDKFNQSSVLIQENQTTTEFYDGK